MRDREKERESARERGSGFGYKLGFRVQRWGSGLQCYELVWYPQMGQTQAQQKAFLLALSLSPRSSDWYVSGLDLGLGWVQVHTYGTSRGHVERVFEPKGRNFH